MKTPCRFPGCRSLLDKGGYCHAHAHHAKQSTRIYDRTTRRNDPALAEAKRIRSSARWIKVQRLFITEHPLCQDPFGDHQRRGTTETGQQVHHIKPLATHPHLAYDFENLMSVCTTCHAKIESRVRRTSPADDDIRGAGSKL